MVVLTAEQVRAWDAFTMQREPIPSIDLMERAAEKCVEWILANVRPDPPSFYIFCGKGNNGGDGLAIARRLHEEGKKVEVFILEFGHIGSSDFQQNLHRLHSFPVNIHFIQPGSPLPAIPAGVVVIDALLGTGLNRPVDGKMQDLIIHLNQHPNPVISIDMPSGLFADSSTQPNTCIRAGHTLSFQCYKPALLYAENGPYLGELTILDIGLDARYLSTIRPVYELSEKSLAASILQPRRSFSHKGDFGHALLLVGATGKMGAALLAAEACLRSGPGLLTCMVPANGSSILQTALPEAMVITGGSSVLEGPVPDTGKYRTIGCGPGIGTDPSTALLLRDLLSQCKQPMVWDADALNLLSMHPEWLADIPPFSILTPHPKEFARLAGPSANEAERLQRAKKMAMEHRIIVVLKGHHSFIAMPGGSAYFNMSGNASMAKGGSGDVLTGMLTGLLCRGYAPEHAALLGVYLHGLAGELASRELGMESVLARDIIHNIGNAFQLLTA